MFPTYTLAFGARQAGMVVLEGACFRFYASDRALRPLEERSFSTLRDAAAAARALLDPCAALPPGRVEAAISA